MFAFLPDLLGDKDFIIPEFKRYIKMMNSKGITSIKEWDSMISTDLLTFSQN